MARNGSPKGSPTGSAKRSSNGSARRSPEEAAKAPRKGAMEGLFLLLTDGPPPDGGPLLARIEGELYALLFSNAQRAALAMSHLGVTAARPFYVCAANREQVSAELITSGARGFIVDYDAGSSTFSSAGAIPSAA